jgi:hypothetical protein
MTDILTGPLGLFIRLALVWASGWLASNGFGIYDEATGTLTFHIDSIANAAAAFVTGGAWFAWWRAAKARGGAT